MTHTPNSPSVSVREALAALVRLKDLKESDPAEYERQRPQKAAAWQAARAALVQPAPAEAINLNQRVRVRLTDCGLNVLEQHYSELRQHVEPLAHSALPTPQADAQGWHEFQLWSLMQCFGAALGNGRDCLFEDCEIYICVPAESRRSGRAEAVKGGGV